MMGEPPVRDVLDAIAVGILNLWRDDARGLVRRLRAGMRPEAFAALRSEMLQRYEACRADLMGSFPVTDQLPEEVGEDGEAILVEGQGIGVIM